LKKRDVIVRISSTLTVLSTLSLLAGCGGGGGGGGSSTPLGPPPVNTVDFSSGFPASIDTVLVNNVNSNQPNLLGKPTKQATSLFTIAPMTITKFTNSFEFAIDAGASNGDGLTFCMQGLSSTALGGYGEKLGYGNITKSVAVKFDTFQNAGDPSANCTGLFVNGVDPIGGTDLTPSGIDLHSGDTFAVHTDYDGTTLTVTIRDTTTNVTATQHYTVDIPSQVGGNAAFVGFTGASDVGTHPQQLLEWKITSP